MKGKVKKVFRSKGQKFPQGNHWEHGDYSRRITQTYAKLDNRNDVILDEDEIREAYGRKNITDKLINDALQNDLKGKELEYDEREKLVGKLTDYIK